VFHGVLIIQLHFTRATIVMRSYTSLQEVFKMVMVRARGWKSSSLELTHWTSSVVACVLWRKNRRWPE